MELSQIRYFKALAENGNLTKTAAELYISAPSLSLSISRLERELGTTLFDRVRGRMYLNPFGRAFLDAVSKGLDEIDTATKIVRAIGNTSDSRVSIATTDQTAWNSVVAAFLREYPDVQFSHQNYKFSLFENADLLAHHDFILTRSGLITSPHLVRRDLYTRNELMVSVPRTHPLAGRTSVRLEELAKERFLFPPKGYGMHDYYLGLCREAGFEPNIVAQCDFAMLTYLNRQGLGLAFTYTPTRDTVLLEIEGKSIQRTQAIYWDRRRKLSKAACDFRSFAIEFFYEKNKVENHLHASSWS